MSPLELFSLNRTHRESRSEKQYIYIYSTWLLQQMGVKMPGASCHTQCGARGCRNSGFRHLRIFQDLRVCHTSSAHSILAVKAERTTREQQQSIGTYYLQEASVEYSKLNCARFVRLIQNTSKHVVNTRAKMATITINNRKTPDVKVRIYTRRQINKSS